MRVLDQHTARTPKARLVWGIIFRKMKVNRHSIYSRNYEGSFYIKLVITPWIDARRVLSQLSNTLSNILSNMLSNMLSIRNICRLGACGDVPFVPFAHVYLCRDINIYIYIYKYTHIHMYIYIYIFI